MGAVQEGLSGAEPELEPVWNRLEPVPGTGVQQMQNAEYVVERCIRIYTSAQPLAYEPTKTFVGLSVNCFFMVLVGFSTSAGFTGSGFC